MTLRAFQASDVDALYEIQGNRAYMRHTYWAESRDTSKTWLERHEATRGINRVAPWTAVRTSDARVIGWGGLGIDPLDPGWGVEVSYFFHPAVAGMGFATELVHAALAYGFDEHGFTRIVAFARPENRASSRVLEKCGFAFVCYEGDLERNRYERTLVQHREERP